MVSDYRIIDLTKYVGTIQGEYRTEELAGVIRWCTITRYITPVDWTFMHRIDTNSHTGTHVEVPSHGWPDFFKEGIIIDPAYQDMKDCTEMPIESFAGEAVILNFDSIEPGGKITREALDRTGRKVHKGDIVLLTTPYSGSDRPIIDGLAVPWLLEKEIKMLGSDDSISYEQVLGPAKSGLAALHKPLFTHNIPMVEQLTNLCKVKEERFFFVAAPLKFSGLEASPVRAIAIEGLLPKYQANTH